MDALHNTPFDSAIKALRSLRPGESYIYFTGFLDHERLTDPIGQNARIADFAYTLMEGGTVTLIQRRVSQPKTRAGAIDWHNGCGKGFQYIAIGIHPKARKPNFTYAQIVRSERF